MAGRKSIPPENRKGYNGKRIPTFCKNVRLKRIEKGMTQQQLADIIGAKRPRIAEIEKGNMTNDAERIIAIAKALGCSLDYLFGISPPSDNA